MPLMFISLGSIIGSGWLLGALTAATAAGGASLVSWVLAGVVIVVPVLTIVVLIVVSFHPGNFTAGGGFAPYGAHGIFAALPLGVVFALQGFEQAVQMAGEARDPQRNIPLAVIGAVIIGTVIYIGLEIALVGALDPANLVDGWANPVGKGDYGPYATLATSLGLGWLAVILYIDAFVPPAGTALVYVGTSARLSYALGHAGYVPKGSASSTAGACRGRHCCWPSSPSSSASCRSRAGRASSGSSRRQR
jgi:amino acid transporter